MVSYQVENKANAAKLEDVRFYGAIEEKLQRVIQMRAMGPTAKEAFAEAEGAFINQVDDKDAPNGIWQGEFWGKLMISACRLCRYTGSEELKQFLRGSVCRVLRSQREDGYLGTYKNDRLVFRVDPDKSPLGDCDWNWNIWCRKYTLWGLLEAYELLGEEFILQAAQQSASQLIDMLEDMQVPVCETGTFFGAAAGSILKPMLILYRHTENRKFLDFALEIAKEWQDETTCCCKMINNALEGVPPMYWNWETSLIPMTSAKTQKDLPGSPKTKKPETTGKVYETLSCFDGLLELYRVTGTQKYLDACKAYYKLLMKYEYNTLFSVGFNDLFMMAGQYQDSLTELCDVIHFMRLTSELYKLTLDPQYMDVFELAFVNPFLAGTARDGSWAARMVRACGGHHYARLQAGFTKNHCCTNNMPRGFMNAADSAVMVSKDALYVNLYTPIIAHLHPTADETVSVRIGDGFLHEGKVTIQVASACDRKLCLYLRMPSWSMKTEAFFRGKSVSAEGGCPLILSLDPNEKLEIELCFDRQLQVRSYHYDTNVFPLSPYLLGRYSNGKNDYPMDTLAGEGKVSFCYGPILLARSVEGGAFENELFGAPALGVTEASAKAVESSKLMKNGGFAMAAFDVTVQTADGENVLRMYDFASASDVADENYHKFSIFC